jgi:predicted ribosome quality control (RQC) complex YloA/Tae2 family protein
MRVFQLQSDNTFRPYDENDTSPPFASDTLFYLGENAVDNHRLTGSAPKDTWFFHASFYPSAHGILTSPNHPPDNNVTRQCAQLLKASTRHTSLHVDMISRKYVTLGKRTGEVILKRGPRSVWVV